MKASMIPCKYAEKQKNTNSICHKINLSTAFKYLKKAQPLPYDQTYPCVIKKQASMDCCDGTIEQHLFFIDHLHTTEAGKLHR